MKYLIGFITGIICLKLFQIITWNSLENWERAYECKRLLRQDASAVIIGWVPEDATQYTSRTTWSGNDKDIEKLRRLIGR